MRQEVEGEKDGVWGEWEKRLLLIQVIMRNFGMADAASDNAQNRARRLEENRREKEVARNS